MRTPLTLILALAGCVLLVVFGATWLTVRIEQQAIDQTRQAHEEFILGNLRNTIEATLTLGLTLEQSSSLQPLIEREKIGMPDIGDISILGPSGRVLYSTDLGLLGATVPSAWTRAGVDRGIRCADEQSARRCSIGLRDELGREAGGLVLIAPPAAQAYSLQAWLARGLPTLALAVLAVLVSTVGVCLLARRRLRPFLQAGQILQDPAASGDDRDPLVAVARQAGARHQARQRALDSQLLQLKELDHAGD